MQYVEKDDIDRMSQMYDCSCEVRTNQKSFIRIFVQTIVDFIVESFNELSKCLRTKKLKISQDKTCQDKVFSI